MTRLRMLTLIRLLSGETDSTNSYWSDAEINSMINDTQLLVAERVPVNMTFRTFDTVASTQRYALPVDFLQLKSVHIQSSTTQDKELTRLGYDEFGQVSDGNKTMEGEPSWFKMEFGSVLRTDDPQLPGDIYMYPIPDAVYETKIRYFQRPTDLDADGNISELPIGLHMAVVYYSVMLIAMKDGNQQKITNMNSLYEQKILASEKSLSRVDRTGHFSVRDGAGYTKRGVASKRIRRGPVS